jgi:short-subunit dehydrogenase
MASGATVIIGGTQGLGRRLAERFAERGQPVLITGRDEARAGAVAREIGGETTGAALDLTVPAEIAAALDPLEAVDHVVLAAIERDANTIRDYDIERALRLATLKLVGYTEVLHCLHSSMHDDT